MTTTKPKQTGRPRAVKFFTRQAFAELCKISLTTLRKYIDEDLIRVNSGNNLIANTEIEAFKRAYKIKKGVSIKIKVPTVPILASSNGKTDPDALRKMLGDPNLDEHSAKRINEILKARKSLTELEMQSGQLVKVDEATAAVFKIGRFIRDGMLLLPVRVADQIAAIDDPNKIEKILTKEITKVLTNIPKGKEWGFKK